MIKPQMSKTAAPFGVLIFGIGIYLGFGIWDLGFAA